MLHLPGEVVVAETALEVPGADVSGDLVHGAGPAGGAGPGSVDSARDGVGDRADAHRERLGAGLGTAAGLLVEDGVAGGRPVLEASAADEDRFVGVTCLGVDEHVWHHWHHVSTKPVDHGGRGPKEFTGMVDLTRDKHGRVRARLLDLVPGRSGDAYKTWLKARGDTFRAGVQVATLDPFHGYKNAIDDQLADAVAVLDAFHLVKLGTAALDEVRRRVQQHIHGHRGRKHDPLYRIRNILRAGVEHLTDGNGPAWKQRSPPTSATSRSKSPGTAPNSCDPSTTNQTTPRGAGSRRRSSPRSPHVRSPRSPASAEP